MPAALDLARDMTRPAVRSMLLGSTALTRFGVNGVEAALALDFIGSEYRTANTSTTFADAFMGNSPKLTYNPGSASSSQSTMTQGYGPELVTNGDFSGGSTGWTVLDATLSTPSGELKVDHANATQWVYQQLSGLTVGRTYEVAFDAWSPAGITGPINLQVDASLYSNGQLNSFFTATTARTTHKATFTAESTTDFLMFFLQMSSGETLYFDNISVREAPKIVWAPHNLLDYSEDAAQNDQTFIGGVSSNVAEAPDGTQTADLLHATTGSSTNSYIHYGQLDLSSQHTCRVWAKKSSDYDWFRITFDTAAECCGWFNLQTGAKGTERNGTASISDAGDGWWLCTWTATKDSSTAIIFGLTDANEATAADNTGGTASMYIWGAHVYRSDLGGMAPVPGAATGFETYVPTNGAAEYLPRVGHHVYNGSAWVNEGLLIESEPRTNLVYPSQFPTPAVGLWAAPNGATAVVDQAGPDGLTSAATLTASSTGTERRWRIATTQSNSTTHTLSFYAKAGSSAYIYARNIAVSGNPAVDGVWWDVSDFSVAVQGSGVAVAGSHPVGNGWYRCYMTATTASSPANNLVDIGISDTAGAVTATSGDTGIFYGAQLEQAPTPSSYIPTSGSTVTRGAQSLTVPPAEFGWDSSAVSLQMDGRMTYADNNQTTELNFVYWYADNNNSLRLALTTGGALPATTGSIDVVQRDNAVTDRTLSAVDYYSPGILTPFNISSRHGSTFVNGAVDGVALAANTTPTALPDLSNTDLQIAADFMGTIGTFRQFAGDIGDAGLVTATNPSTEPTLSLTFDGTGGSFYNLSWSE